MRIGIRLSLELKPDMYEADKLEEAEYFLKRMASIADDRKAHKHNLSAFLTAGRSVLQFACEEAVTKPGGQAWYDNQVCKNSVVKFFKDRRDVNIHYAPVHPNIQFGLHIEESLRTGIAAEAVVIRDEKEVSREAQQAAPLMERTNSPYPSKVTMTEAYRFSEWTGAEDLPTLCSMYLTELRRIVADGQSNGCLTPQ